MEYKDIFAGPSQAEEAFFQAPTSEEAELTELLFRRPQYVGDPQTMEYYKGKTILVTGGGGSIGSELCRTLAACEPKRLILLDIYENNVYDLQQELLRKYGKSLDLCVEIASVRDGERLDCVFAHYKPQIVFHAAAHKHVPLMEQNGCEAVKNNVLGTQNTALAAEKHGAEKFILISTDKAVNPTSIMGASKRLCEMLLQCKRDSGTVFAAVRFGNVLGSNGSVIPLFKRQIRQGGPVTLTDRRIVRYFMTVTEACRLIMQAGFLAKRGELFVLDMGKPIRIYDLAVHMIRLEGLEPEVDIRIEEVGLRPGEKLYEEILLHGDRTQRTDHRGIFVEKDEPLTRADEERILERLDRALEESRHTLDSEGIRQALRELVPTYKDPQAVNQNAASAPEMKKTGEN